MSGILNESASVSNPLAGALAAGLETLDQAQTVVFTQYVKQILPADGYVFWVATSNTVTVKGSVHYGVNKEQNEDETIAINRVIFTAESEIQQFSVVSPSVIYIGTFPLPTAGDIMFAFSQQGDFYQQADLFHYVGNAIYPAMMSQIVSSAADLAALEPIVSNSLPVWLSLTQFGPVYPSFLVPDNIAPPYIVAHVGEEDTDALQPLPYWDAGISFAPAGIGYFQIGISAIGGNRAFANPDPDKPGFFFPTSTQLASDKVRLTLYGFTNRQAISYRDYLFQYSMNTDAFGVCGKTQPIIRDDKRTQRELGIIAQKKTLDLEVSYYQSAINDIAETLILSASCTFNIGAV